MLERRTCLRVHLESPISGSLADGEQAGRRDGMGHGSSEGEIELANLWSSSTVERFLKSSVRICQGLVLGGQPTHHHILATPMPQSFGHVVSMDGIAQCEIHTAICTTRKGKIWLG